MATPNRLDLQWKKMKPLLLKQWDKLTQSDLDSVDCEFDRLVDVVRQRYGDPVYTVKEADIRFLILKMLEKLENEEAAASCAVGANGRSSLRS